MIIDSKFFSDTLNLHARTLVGKFCKQNELIASKKDLTEAQKLQLLKDFGKELVYEEVRSLENQVKAFSEGKEYAKIYKTPTP